MAKDVVAKSLKTLAAPPGKTYTLYRIAPDGVYTKELIQFSGGTSPLPWLYGPRLCLSVGKGSN